jgi:hypothetical protein
MWPPSHEHYQRKQNEADTLVPQNIRDLCEKVARQYLQISHPLTLDEEKINCQTSLVEMKYQLQLLQSQLESADAMNGEKEELAQLVGIALCQIDLAIGRAQGRKNSYFEK